MANNHKAKAAVHKEDQFST